MSLVQTVDVFYELAVSLLQTVDVFMNCIYSYVTNCGSVL